MKNRHIEKKIIGRYGDIPKSLESVFDTDAEDMFLYGVEEAVKNRKEDTLERYIDIARIVFGFFNHFYEYMDSLTYRDKLSLLTGSKIPLAYWDDLLERTETILRGSLLPYDCKVSESTPLLDHYDHMMSLLNERNPHIQNYLFTTHHFKNKLLTEKHPSMADHLYTAFQEDAKRLGLESEVAKVLVAVESLIHGIDDYVDEGDQGENEAFADVTNIVFSLFGLVYYLLKTYKLTTKDRILSLTGKPTRLQQFLDNIVYLTTDQTEIPFLERDILKIVEIGDDVIEHELADQHLRVRAIGAIILTNYVGFILAKEKDPEFEAIIDLVTTYRMLELLSKDILDIERDVLQGDNTPPSAWALKHGKESKEFKDRIKKLADVIYDEAKNKYPKISRHESIRNHYNEQIRDKHAGIMKRL
jgi:hypothetical protein